MQAAGREGAIASRPKTRHQCSSHRWRGAVNLGPILLAPFWPGAAHIVQLGAVVVEQRLGQRLPRHEAFGQRHIGGLSPFA